MPTSLPRWPEIKAVFEAAMQRPAAERDALIAAAGLDPVSVAELRSLLQHHDDATGAGGFLSAPAAGEGDVAAPPSREGQRLGAWQIVRAVGVGGMGEVFEARRADGQYEGRAAVKLLKRGMDSAAVLQRFAQERQALARLGHPHIARLLDAGASDEGLPYFVMEYVQGRPIDEAARALALDERLRLFLQLADAVAYAHRNLLVHRDLKPGNVLVDGEGQVKLLDFGIAKALDPLESLPGETGGDTTVGGVRPYTPHYASPEQVRGEPVSTATDIYSLGVLLYQMLTGTRPTGRGATTPAEAARCVLEDEPTRPSRLSPEQVPDPHWLATRRRLQGDLDNILLKALEKGIERRYATVDALAADIQAYLQGRPVSARAASPAYVLGKFVRRNRWAVLAGGLGGLGLASGLAAALLQGRAATAVGVVGLAGGLGLALWKGREAALARDLAQSRLTETRAIVSDVMVRHADTLHYLPGGLRRKAELLENMLGHLDRLAAQARGDGALAGEVALGYARLADLQGDNQLVSLGRVADSDANAAKALALFEDGAAAHAGNPVYGMWWARAWRVRALALRAAGDVPGALRTCERMLAVTEDFLQRHPHDTDLLSEAGSAHFLRGQLHDTWGVPCLGDPEGALAAFTEAERCYRQLQQQDVGASAEDQAVYRHQLGTIGGARMIVFMKHGRGPEAAACGREAVALARTNVEHLPDHLGMRQGLAVAAINLSSLLVDLGLAEEAVAYAKLGYQAAAAMAAAEPDDATWHQACLRQGLHLGRALAAAGRPAEALPHLQTLAQADWLPGAPGGQRRLAWVQLELASTWQALGDAVQARQVALTAEAGWQAFLADHADDGEAWVLRARTQRLLFALSPAEASEAWRSGHAASAERARACGPVPPWYEQFLMPLPEPTA